MVNTPGGLQSFLGSLHYYLAAALYTTVLDNPSFLLAVEWLLMLASVSVTHVHPNSASFRIS